jgi:hypothetical protein
LRINFNSGAVAYNDWQLNKTNIHLTGTENKLLFEGTVDSLRNSTITLHHLQTTGFYMDTSAQANVIVSDDKAKDMYVVSASMHTDDMGAHFHLQDNLVLNYDQWDVDESNRVVVQSSGFNVQQMRIGREGQLIHIQSDGEAAGAPLNIEIKDFQLSTLTRIINQDTLLADGSLNAKLKLQHFDLPVPYIQGNLEVDTLFVQGTELGNLKVGAVSENGKIDFEGLLSGTENHVEINGKYSEKLIDADIRLNPLSLKTIQSFSQGNLKNSSGNVSGDVKLTGPLSNPAWNGNVKFNDVSTRLTGYGSVLRIDDQEVALRYPEIVLNKFTVKDSLMNPLFIDGMVMVDDAFQIKPDLKISAKKFMLLDNKQSENEFIYGKAMIEINADVKGTVDAPVLTGNLILKNGSEVTYVRQTTSASLKERDEWIEFIDMDTIPDLLKYHTKGDVREISDRVLPGSSIKMDLDVSTETETVLNIVIDPVNKDKLSVQGEAGLNLSTSAGGEYLLTGLYELNKGSYQLKYGLINKDFKLQPGSFIQFNGNPMKAQAQITAIYELETSAGELIGNELNSEAGTTTSLNRKIPFQILLNIQGTVSKPQLSFDIKMQEKAEGVSYDIATAVDNKLQQLRNDPSAMNKQVFALLMFNRFIGEQSSDFFGGAGSVTADNILANESVSAFLGAAIDKIAEDLISNVDIDVNIKNVENTSGNRRTDLNLALGSSFMNDRLTVTFGQRFTLDGQDPSAKSQNSKTQFIPNIQTTYKLSRDGRYMLRAYRMNQYEAIMDGYFIETGLTFTLKMDYDKFKELFKRSKK